MNTSSDNNLSDDMNESDVENESDIVTNHMLILAKALINKQPSVYYEDNTEYDLEFSMRIRVAIRESDYHSFAQEKLARMFKVKQNTISTWMSGRSKPEIETGILVCKVLNISLDWLYTGRGPMRPLREAENEYEKLTLRILRTRPSYIKIVMNLLDQLETVIHD